MAAVTICSDFGVPQKIKSDTVSTVSPSISHEVMGPGAMILVFWMLSFRPTFLLSSLYMYSVIMQNLIYLMNILCLLVLSLLSIFI